MTLRAGVASVDFTPPAGTVMACFPRSPGRRPRRAAGALDPLTARAVALADDETTVVLCACDLAMIRLADVRRIRAAVAGALPHLPPAAVHVAATHTHHAPETAYLFGGAPEDAAAEGVRRAIVEAVVAAARRLRPAALRFAQGPCSLNHNRRATDARGPSRMVFDYAPGAADGVCDPTLSVLRLDRDGEGPVLLCHWAAHGLARGPSCERFTADYPGVLRRTLEARLPGAAAVFLNGAAGNLHPRESMRDDAAAAERIGRGVAEAALALAQRAAPLTVRRLGHRTETLRFANRLDASLSVELEASCLALGELRLALAPGEIFCEYALQLRQALAPRPSVLVGYADGWPGYIPTPAAYEEGGYGVEAAAEDPAPLSRTALPPGAGERLLAALVRLAGGDAAVAVDDRRIPC